MRTLLRRIRALQETVGQATIGQKIVGQKTVGLAMLAFLLPSFIFTALDNQTHTSYFSDLCFFLYTSISLLFFIRATYHTRLHKPALFMPWLLLSLSVVSILCAVGTWIFVEIVSGGRGTTTTGALPMLLSHLLFGWGIYSLPQSRQDPLQRMRQTIDLLIIMIGCGLLLWALWINPSLQQGALDITAVTTLTLYLLSDLVLVAALVSLLFRQQLLQPHRPLAVLSISIFAMLLADIWLALQNDIYAYQPGGFTDHFYLIAVIVGTIGAKMQVDSINGPTRQPVAAKWLARFSRALRIILPPLLLIATYVVMIVTHETENPYNFYLMATGIGVMFILVSVHQIFTLFENVNLTVALRAELLERRQAQDELQQTNETLEQHVGARPMNF
ncbi:MAG: hypothetical protein R2932_22570 [Caldilineaceae bacterium]